MIHTRRRASAVVPAGMLALMLSTGAGAATPTSSDDVPDGMEFDAAAGRLRSDILEMDAAAAVQSGLDYSEALGRLRAQSNAEALERSLSDRYPNEFAGLYLDNGAVLVAQFKAQVPPGAQKAVSAVAGRTELVTHSRTDLVKMADDAAEVVTSLGLTEYVVGIDPSTNSIFATIGRLSDDGVGADDAIASARQRLSRLGVSVDLVEGRVDQSLNALGGAEIWGGMSLTCTTGFSVVQGGTTGISTAGHCPHPAGIYYWDPYPGVQHSHGVTYVNSTIGPFGDFQWLTTVTTEVDDFYRTPAGNVRDVTGVMNSLPIGQVLGWYGRKSKVEYFGTIGWVGITSNGAGNLACMNQGNGQTGDSGGPVYSSGLAAGLISKLVSINGAWRLCFSQARYIDDGLGVSIKTS